MADCWSCAYRYPAKEEFFGRCRYFETVGKQAKVIPSTVVDKGCKFFKAPELKQMELIQTEKQEDPWQRSRS